MAWSLDGTKPLSEPMMVSLLMRIYASLGLSELNKTNVITSKTELSSKEWLKGMSR